MTFDQGMLFALFAAILGLLLSGRIRHDLVAAAGLLLAVLLGLVPEREAFSGFANHAVIIVALVLVASRAFENTGALALLARIIPAGSKSISRHIAVTSGLGAALSAVINNVAALALLMPLDVQSARKAGRPPGLTLMPLAFATILGGMVTLIGTPPNIIASAIREERLGKPYELFDFAPVGLSVAIAGIAFVALFGWRLVPRREDKAAALMREPSSFKAELLVAEDSPSVGRLVADLDEPAERSDVLVLGLVRSDRRHYAVARTMTLAANDILIIEGSTESIAAFIKAAGLQEPVLKDEAPDTKPAIAAEPDQAESKDKAAEAEAKEPAREPRIVEAVARADSRVIGRSARSLDLRRRFGVTLLGVAHAGTIARDDVRDRAIEAGDVLLLTGRQEILAPTLNLLGLLPIGEASVSPFRPLHAALAVGLFVAAIIAATAGLLSFTVAIAIAVAVYAALGLVPARDFYTQIEWPVVVMLACLLPIGAAFDRVGGTSLVADAIVRLTEGYAPVVALVAMMVATMMLSDILNNVATMVITGPIAVDLAQRIGANPDAFLMGVAIASSCAFLTPIGHKNNTLIMGPGAFRFADYWRMGLPLELIVLAVSVPALLLFWPL